MCIALLSTAHPLYKLILLSNRDEYLTRPTAPATWWSPEHPTVLGGRDLLRPTRGTWLGITRTGHLAVLTNYREDTPPPAYAVSRGEIIKTFLTRDPTDPADVEDWAKRIIATGTARDAGGFTLVCGHVLDPRGLVVLSNRAEVGGGPLERVGGEVVQTVGVSNGPFDVEGTSERWPKVVEGERQLLRVIREDIVLRERSKSSRGRDAVNGDDGKDHNDDGGRKEGEAATKDDENETKKAEDRFLHRLLEILSTDTLTPTGIDPQAGLDVHVQQLRNTILVPPLGKTLGNQNTKPNTNTDTNMNMNMNTHTNTDTNTDTLHLTHTDAKANNKTDPAHSTLKPSSSTPLPLSSTTQPPSTTQVETESNLYATQKQSIVLIDQTNRVRFFERTLFDGSGRAVVNKEHGAGDVQFEFQIEADGGVGV